MSGNFVMGLPNPDFSNVVMQTKEIQTLRTEMDNLNISNPVVVVKQETSSTSASPDEDDPMIMDIADWPHCKSVFSNFSYRSPPVFRDPSYQQAPMFIKLLEEYFESAKIPYQQQLTLAKSLFRGPSNNWKDFHESKWNCYKDFRRHFLLTFWSDHQQFKEKERLSYKKYTPTNKSQLEKYFLRMLDKYRFFTPQLSEDVILENIMSKYSPEIQSEWAVRSSKTIPSALSFLQAQDAVNNSSFNGYVEPERIQRLNHQMDTLDISNNEVNDLSKNVKDICTNSSNQQNATIDFTQPQQATFVFDNKLTAPIYLAGQNPSRFIKNLQDYFTFAMVPPQHQLTVVKGSIRGMIKDWMNRNQEKWTCFEDFHQNFLTTFWNKEMQSCEWLKLDMHKFIIGRSNLSDFFAFMVNRYRLFHPPLSEEMILKETMCKYPVEIQSLWAASGCTTLRTTLVFLERQDEVGILKVLGNSNLSGEDAKASSTILNYSTILNDSERVQRLDRQMGTLRLEDTAAFNTAVKSEHNLDNPSMSDDIQQQHSVVTIKMKVSPPLFQDKNVQHAAQFIKKLQEFFSLAQIADEHQLNVAKSLLRGNVTEWKDFHEVYWTSFDDFRRDFFASFWSEHRQRQAREKLDQSRFSYGRRNDTLTRYFLNQVRSYRLFTPYLSDTEIVKEIMQHFPDDITSEWRYIRDKTLDAAFRFLEDEESKRNNLDPTSEFPARRVWGECNCSPYPVKQRVPNFNHRSNFGKIRPHHPWVSRMPR